MYFEQLCFNDKLYVASKILKKSKEQLLLNKFEINREMEEVAKLHILNLKPLSKIFKEKYFWKWRFFTNEYTLDPRPVTEDLIEIFLQNHKKDEKFHFLELGLGSGVISITILKLFPNSTCTAIEICPNAIKVAKKNAKKLKVLNRMNIKNENWLTNINENFSILISNPPYLTEKEIFGNLIYDPHISLYGGIDGLDRYRDIASKSFLFEEIYIEIPPAKESEIINMLKNFEIYKNYNPYILYLKKNHNNNYLRIY